MNLLHTLAHLFHPRRSNNHRPRILHPEALVYIALILVGFTILVYNLGRFTEPFGSILGYASNISVGQVVAATNSQRQAAGLGELQLNGLLSQAAQAKAQDMFASQYWAHTSPSGLEPWDFIRRSGYGFKRAGENLARDFDTTDSMMAAWMASPTHRANIMNGEYQEIGIAVTNGVLQGVETTLVVQMFGTPAGSNAPAQIAPSAATAQQPAVNLPSTPRPSLAPSPVPTPSPSVSPTPQPTPESSPIATPLPTQESPQQVLARFIIPRGEILPLILFSPLQLLKAFFLSVILLLITILAYDYYVVGHRRTARLVGKNIAHIMLFLMVAFLILFFKAGSID